MRDVHISEKRKNTYNLNLKQQNKQIITLPLSNTYMLV